VRPLGDPPRLGISQRPQHDQGRLRPEGEVEGEQRGLLACFDLFDRLPEHGGQSCRVRVGAVVQETALDVVASGCRPCPQTSSICRSDTSAPSMSPSAARPRPHHLPGGRPAVSDSAEPGWRGGVAWTLLWIENTASQLTEGSSQHPE
jgi:hypothetical protein